MSILGKTLARLALSTACFLANACGGGGEPPPPPPPPPADVSGTWSVTENGTSTCPNQATYANTYQVTIAMQGANGISVQTPVGTFTGTLNGHNLSWHGSYPEDSGTTTISALSATVANDNQSFSGSSDWSWRDGSSSCSGRTQSFVGRRIGAPAPPQEPPQGPAFTGFNFPLTTGTFWEYRWDYFERSGDAQGTTTTKDRGRFWLLLGAPTAIAGVNAYPVEILGKSRGGEGAGARTFAPRWKYLAMNGNKLLGSKDGASLETIFDANTGKWPGGGFFAELDARKLTIAQAAALDNSYLHAEAIRAGRAVSTSQCEFFPGIGTICGGDMSQTLIEDDYFKSGIGPVGYYYKNSASWGGIGTAGFVNWEHHLGKTASSFDGQPLPFVNESNAPHAAPASAQALQIGNVVRGEIADNDPAYATSVTINGTSVPISIEDWYAVTVAGPTTLRLTLSFEASTAADLDLYLISQGVRGLTFHAMSVTDNAALKNANESIEFNLPAAGTYFVAVDAFKTAAGRIKYELQVE